MYPFFFFSSRRRHTRWNCDWSSDVCSSDLVPDEPAVEAQDSLAPWLDLLGHQRRDLRAAVRENHGLSFDLGLRDHDLRRSEERRVGKECTSWWSTYHYKKK